MRCPAIAVVFFLMFEVIALPALAQPEPVYNPFNGHYYTVLPDQLTWNAARAAAGALSYRGVNGHLATITSVQEAAWVLQNAGLESPESYWLGGVQPPGSTEPDGGWQWITGEAWDYTAWRSGEPNNSGLGPEETIVLVTPSGGWNDVAGSSESNPSIVEFDLPRPSEALAILVPGAGAVLAGGEPLQVHWRADRLTAGTAVIFELHGEGGFVAFLGIGWHPDGETTTTLQLPLLPGGDRYRLRAASLWDRSVFTETAGYVTVIGSAIALRSPRGGEQWPAGTRQAIHWNANPAFAGSALRFELWGGGGRIVQLGTDWNMLGDGVFWITVPDVAPGTDYRIRAVSLWDEQQEAWNDGAFTIQNPDWTQSAVHADSWMLYR